MYCKGEKNISINPERREVYIPYAFILTLFLLLFVNAATVSAQELKNDEPSSIGVYKLNRKAYDEKKETIKQRYQSSLAEVENNIGNIRRQIEESDAEITRINNKIAQTNAVILGLQSLLASIAIILFPFASTWSVVSQLVTGNLSIGLILIYLCVPVTAINLYLYLKRREKTFFTQHKFALTTFLIILLCLFATPLFASELSKYHADISEQLDRANKVLSLSDHQKFIAILESEVNNEINVPSLPSNNPLLFTVQKVKPGSIEYYFTLAALYNHENQAGKSVDSISKIIELQSIPSSDLNDEIIVNSIKYLVQQQQTAMASSGAEHLSGKIKSVALMLDLSTFLHENGMQASADTVLTYATRRAASVSDLIDMAKYFIDSGKNELATDALGRAINKAENIQDIAIIATFAIEEKKDSVIKELAQKVTLISDNFEDSLSLVDLFLEHSRKEDAITVFTGMSDQVQRSTKDYSEKLLFLINAALQRNLLEQAIKTTSKLSLFLGMKSYQYNVPSTFTPDSNEAIEDPDKVSLPLFYGILNERLNFNGKAELAYIRTVLFSLVQILKSYGYELPDTLNAYNLLGNIWVQENRAELIGKLDAVYTSLENQSLAQLEKELAEQISERNSELESLKVLEQEKSAEFQKLKDEHIATVIRLVVTIVATVLVVLFLLAIFIGCVILAQRYSNSLKEHKMYGFVSKFIELTGWVRIMSIVGAFSGLVTVILAQLMQIIQANQENNRETYLSLTSGNTQEEYNKENA